MQNVVKSSTLINAFIKPVEDAYIFLNHINTKQFSMPLNGPFSSTIGQHMRHILDHYIALMHGIDINIVDYNQRTRNSSIETDMNMTKVCWDNIHKWIINLNMNTIEKSLDVITEHSRNSSTIARELSFVSSHADHHFAIMKLLAFSHGVSLPAKLGVAPATLKAQNMN